MIAANGLQVWRDLVDVVDIPDNINDRRSGPAKVIDLFEFNEQPIAVKCPPAYRADIAGIQVGCMKIGSRWSVPAVRLFIDGYAWEREGWRGCDRR